MTAAILVAVLLGLRGLEGLRTKTLTVEELRTGKLTVVNSQGKTVATLGGSSRHVALNLYDNNGRERATLMLSDVGSSLRLDGSKDESGFTELASREEGTHLILLGGSPFSESHLSASAEGPRLLMVSGAAGNPEFMVKLDEGGSSLELSDALGNVATLGASRIESPTTRTTKRSAASLIMLDKKRRVIWQAP